MSGGPASANIKIILFVFGILIAIGTLYYTQNIVSKLQKREKEIVHLYADGIRYINNSESNSSDYTFIFENIIKPIDFPLILTFRAGERDSFIVGATRNIEIDSSWTYEQATVFMDKQIKTLANINDPILITTSDSSIVNKIYYGDSALVTQLRYYPYIQITFAVIFILIAYVGFSHIKKNEQSNIWVGMSKETAHQLGTPISSLMGWTELLKINSDKKEKVLDVAYEMDNDLSRLNKIANRFSKIGSRPELKTVNLYSVIERVINYFQRRLPQTGKSVKLNLIGEEDLKADLNIELFEWVIENLIKNALDAIEHKNGQIDFNLIQHHDKIEIEVADNGKGIDSKRKKDVFRPGYSTKRRGWGLGLSLSKRIIEDYHKGKISVKNSVIGEGTKFAIMLANPQDES